MRLPKALVIGGAAVDITSKVDPSTSLSTIRHSTVPGSVASTLGGVARNVAEAAHRIRTSSNPLNKEDIMLISPLGRDSFGSLLKEETAALGMRTDGFSYPTPNSSPTGASSSRTAVCNMVLDSRGDLVGGVAYMDIIASMQFKEVKLPTLSSVSPLLTIMKIATKLPSSDPLPAVAMFDGNVGNSVMTEMCQWAYSKGIASKIYLPIRFALLTHRFSILVSIPTRLLPAITDLSTVSQHLFPSREKS